MGQGVRACPKCNARTARFKYFAKLPNPGSMTPSFANVPEKYPDLKRWKFRLCKHGFHAR